MLFDSEHELYVSEYVDKEFKEKLDIKWPDKSQRIYEPVSQDGISLL